MGNEQSTPEHEQRPEPEPQPEPSPPALSRSRSVSSRLANKGSRYLPRALAQPRDEDYPSSSSRSKNIDPSANTESPHWGWYIRTTPTHDMYPSCPMLNVSTGSSMSMHYLSVSHPNPIFQGLQDKNRGSPMGLPSVPL